MQAEKILVVGAGGLGQAVAAHLISQGRSVVVVDRSPETLEACKRMLPQGEIFQVSGDVEDVTPAILEQMGVLGELSGMVHAVGINDRRPLLDTDLGLFERILRTNLTNAFAWSKVVGQELCERGSGSIVLFSSVSERSAHADHGPYAASKGGLRQLMRVMAREWAPRQVRVNCVSPGYTETDLTRDYLDEGSHRETLESLVPMGRLGKPEVVAGLVHFLLSDASSFITGQSIHVDGGRGLL